jgi:hypothetical protein
MEVEVLEGFLLAVAVRCWRPQAKPTRIIVLLEELAVMAAVAEAAQLV